MNKSTNNESRITTNWHNQLYNIYITSTFFFWGKFKCGRPSIAQG